jgi:hypothetical protein
VNVARLRAELEFVTANPRNWDQNTWLTLPHDEAVEAEPGTDWTCGTKACLAGWTGHHNGYEPVSASSTFGRDAAGQAWDVEPAAAEVLNVNLSQTNYLFHGDCTLRDLWEFARVFTDGEIQVPEDVAAGELHVFDYESEDHYASLAEDDDY